jgi:DNA-directed RNA polymerase subunit RPC12/RpoP
MSPEDNTVSNEAPVPKARIVRQDYKDIQGKEAGLSVLSRLCLVAGIVGVLACIIAGLAIGRLSLLAAGIALLMAGLILFVIFGALSEIIRLLKAVNGLPYTGTISGSGTGTIYVCSDCGSLNYPDIDKCRKCGAEFEKQGSEGQSF